MEGLTPGRGQVTSVKVVGMIVWGVEAIFGPLGYRPVCWLLGKPLQSMGSHKKMSTNREEAVSHSADPLRRFRMRV